MEQICNLNGFHIWTDFRISDFEIVQILKIVQIIKIIHFFTNGFRKNQILKIVHFLKRNRNKKFKTKKKLKKIKRKKRTRWILLGLPDSEIKRWEGVRVGS
jgi:hypothetical protein